MFKNERIELEEKLSLYLPVIATNREMINNIRNYYISKNISSSVAMRIINKDTIFELLDDVSLCIFVMAINITNNDFGLSVDKYFTEKDIELAKSYKKDKLEKDNVVIFHNVDQTNEKIWICSKITFDDIVELANEKKIGYNFNTQREGKKILKGKEIVTIPTVNRKAIKEIMNMWKLGTFVPNMITFNAENPLDIEYNPNTRTLKVTLAEDDYFSILDGYHRSISAINIKQQDPSFNLGFYYLRIMNFTEYEAQQFIIQEDKHTPINQEHLKLMDYQDTSSRVAKYISDYGTPKMNPLFHKFAVKSEELDLDKYCLYSTISYPLKYYFDINKIGQIDEVNEIRDVILRGLSYIVSLFPSEFKNFKKSRKTSVATMNGTFGFYMAILSELYKLGYHKQIEISDSRKLENALQKVIKKIDFSFDNPIWRELKIIDENNNMTIKKVNALDCKTLADYADKIVNSEVIS